MNAILALWPFWMAGTWVATATGMCLGIYHADKPRRKEAA